MKNLFKSITDRLCRKPLLVIPDVSISVRKITENDVKMHCVNKGGREFMCKNCGDKYDAFATTRHYCDKCGCWICPKCATKSNLCAGCSTEC